MPNELLGPITLGIFCFLGRDWARHWTLQQPPFAKTPLSLVPELRKIGKRYVKAVPNVLGDEILTFWW